jgi:hypothetical protein
LESQLSGGGLNPAPRIDASSLALATEFLFNLRQSRGFGNLYLQESDFREQILQLAAIACHEDEVGRPLVAAWLKFSTCSFP